MSEKRLFLDRGVGEMRGVLVVDGRPERLLISRDGDPAMSLLGARGVARVRSIERAFAAAFLELEGGVEAILPLKPDMEKIVQGQAIEIEIKSEARRGKSPVARLIGPAEGSPRLLEAAVGVEDELRTLAKVGIVEGPAARQAADDAEAEALETIHPLPGGGTVAIEETRALVAVDVDLGERPGSDSKRAARQANLAALGVAARILRLKGLGGLVVFDLVGRGHDGQALGSAARAAFNADNPGVSIGTISRFGTMEMTVPRRRRPVTDLLTGETAAALHLIRALEREGRAQPGAKLIATCSPAVAQAAKPYEAALAERLGRRFEIVAREGWPTDRFEAHAT